MASTRGSAESAETGIGLRCGQYFRDKKLRLFTFFWADNFLYASPAGRDIPAALYLKRTRHRFRSSLSAYAADSAQVANLPPQLFSAVVNGLHQQHRPSGRRRELRMS